MSCEVFIPIPDLPSYSISPSGQVKSYKQHKLGKILRPANHKGYLRLLLGGKSYLVHRLVAIVYVPNLSCLTEVNHIDGDKRNNNHSNLEWVTHQQNMRHAIDTGLQKFSIQPQGKDNRRSKPIDQLSINGTFIKSWESIALASKGLGISPGNISHAARGRCKTYSGFKWRYKLCQ